MTLADVVSSIESAFPIFSFGDRHIVERLSTFSFDEEGMARRWDWYDRLSRNVLEFLGQRFPEVGQRDRSIIGDLQMNQIREKIARDESEYAYYCSIVSRYPSQM